jgi:hypothetical protein
MHFRCAVSHWIRDAHVARDWARDSPQVPRAEPGGHRSQVVADRLRRNIRNISLLAEDQRRNALRHACAPDRDRCLRSRERDCSADCVSASRVHRRREGHPGHLASAVDVRSHNLRHADGYGGFTLGLFAGANSAHWRVCMHAGGCCPSTTRGADHTSVWLPVTDRIMTQPGEPVRWLRALVGITRRMAGIATQSANEPALQKAKNGVAATPSWPPPRRRVR